MNYLTLEIKQGDDGDFKQYFASIDDVNVETFEVLKDDLDKFVKDNPAMKSYVDKDNNITLSGIKTMYESMGAKCSK